MILSAKSHSSIDDIQLPVLCEIGFAIFYYCLNKTDYKTFHNRSVIPHLVFRHKGPLNWFAILKRWFQLTEVDYKEQINSVLFEVPSSLFVYFRNPLLWVSPSQLLHQLNQRV
ncbi:unnamed protein product [Hymenolepis diminuta]|uniref:Transposase n=1 Tax=Hymenolepis diminuta TaxID=6216 RepID=A0A0R3SEZ8_HYMDI|nr:unnamed protein product [Hymenolepis diminuta]VUZ38882.1 unnamed protein product [Hymenolepis diminuta]